MRHALLVLAWALLLVPACRGTGELTPEGALVRESGLPVPEGCSFLAVVEADANTRIRWANALRAAGGDNTPIDRSGPPSNEIMREIRNRVAELGGDLFVLAGGDAFEAQAEAYRCSF